MPGRRHVRGAGRKEQRMYEHIKQSSQRSGRYAKRVKQVAARTVIKHRRRHGNSKGR